MPIALRFPDRQVLGVTCPSARREEMLCGDAGQIWSANVPQSARSPVALVQLNLTPPR